MGKGAETKAEIIRRAAGIFNRQGYDGASISDVMAATGLEKGGIYRHFDSKDELALSSFDYALGLVNSHYLAAIRSSHHAVNRLEGVVDAFSKLQYGSPIGGGCPIMNTAIDSDDGHPLLRRRAEEALENWHQMLSSVIHRGIERGEINQKVNPEATATQMIALMEGGLMMARLLPEGSHFDHTISSLKSQIHQLRKA